MKSFWVSRALPFALLLVAAAVSTIAAMELVYSKGMAFLASASGLLLQIPIALVLALVTRAVLTRVKKLPPDAQGFAFDARTVKELVVCTLGGVGLLALAALGLWAAGVAPFALSSTPPSALALAVALLSFLVNAVIQQLTLQSLVLAASKDGKLSIGAAGLPLLIFVLTHVEESATPIYLFNVFLFGVVTILLFFRRPSPSYAAPIGFHGGWNFAIALLLGSPPAAPPNTLLRWPEGERLVLGGAAGFEHGLANTIILVAFIGALLTVRRRNTPSN